jgi:drug/metabolite transporter (DMT)-like permease
VNPIVAVLLGWLFAGERISPSIVASTALAIAAIGLVQRGEQQNGAYRQGHAPSNVIPDRRVR